MTPLLDIVVGTHFFQVTPLKGEERIKNLCYQFVKRFVKIDIQGKTQNVTTFAAANAQRDWFRFHFNSLSDFMAFIKANGVTPEKYTLRTLEEPDVPSESIPIKEEWVPKDYQEPIISYLTTKVGAYQVQERKWVDGGPRAKLVGIQTGKGKLIRNGTKIKTPLGWVPIEMIRVGSKVLAQDGTYTEVVGVYPENNVDLFRVAFEDGRHLDVHIEHLWNFVSHEHKTLYTGTTNEMIGSLKHGDVFIPLTEPFDEDVTLSHLVTPYDLGRAMSATGLSGEIPADYMEAGLEDRVNLMRGILEGDFEFGVDFEVIISNNSTKTLKSIQQLVWSLGGKALVDNGLIYIRFKDLTPFFAPDILPVDYEPHQGFFGLKVKHINRVHSGDATCIAVAHEDKMFVCEDYIVTHNTFCALKALHDLGYKFVVIVLAQFVEKWVGDIQNVLKIKPKEILAVKGGKAMMALTEMATNRKYMKPYKAVVISNRTFENYLRAFEQYGDDLSSVGYAVKPDDLWVKLGIGVRLIDEVHMQFHANYRLDLYTHIKRSISLSATLMTRDAVLDRMYKIAYPSVERFHEGPIDKYIETYGVLYRINPRWRYKTSNRGMSSYSHTAFENSIMANKEFLKAYCDMIVSYLDHGYIRNRKGGNKAIVFAATVEMCTEITTHLQKVYKHLNVKRYVAVDPYKENYQEPDIRVTTIGSGGTGHDIKGLIDNHLTVAIDSIQAFIQAYGRLRKIDDQDTRCYFYTCEDIQKHLSYHKNKIAIMPQRAKSFTQTFYGYLGGEGQNFY